MSQSSPDVRRSPRARRRSGILVGITVAAGLLAGAAAASLIPVTATSTALVALPMSGGGCHHSIGAVADGGSMLAAAKLSPAVSAAMSRGDVQVTSLTPSILSVSARAGTAAQAEAEANAVADSYIGYADSAGSPAGHASAQLLQPVTVATGTAGPVRLLVGAGLGVISGLLTGLAAALAGRRPTPGS